MVGASNAGAGYYRYLAAGTNPDARARAVSTVLAGGLVAALAGPFVATAVRDVTRTPYAAFYLLVAVLGLGAALWNTRLRVPALPATARTSVPADEPPRPYGVIGRLGERRVAALGCAVILGAGLAAAGGAALPST